MKSIYAKRQHGAALLAMLAVLALGASWYLVSRLNADSGVATATRKVRNAEVLNMAKQALISYVATRAAEAGENNPGRLPCPEHAWYIGRPEYPDKEGIAGPSVGVTNPGSGIQDCASIGRLPWITLGLEKLVDATGEPLWYVVGPSWRLTTSTSTLLINSNTPSGDITVDGQQTVALIVAPGAAMNVQTSAGCTARNQTRSAPSPTMAALDYIECFDPAILPILQFVTTASSTSFNDQVVRITVADIMPTIEAAIAQRIEREIVPALKTVYTHTTWGFTTPGITPNNPVLPFAATFANPGPGIGTSSFQGAAGTYRGLLPFNQTQGCTAGAANPRCLPSLLSFAALPDASKTAGSGSMSYEDCIFESSISAAGCTIQISNGAATIAMTAVIRNVAMGLRSLSLAGTELWQWSPGLGIYQLISGQSLSATLSSSGAATMRVQANLTVPNPGSTYYYIRLYLKAAGDHPLLDESTTGVGATGWFVRNEWYRLLYYAVSQSNTAARLPLERSCTAAVDCLTVTATPLPNLSGAALLILAGRSINGTTRPSPTLSDYLEFGNAKPTPAFERQTVTPAPASMYTDTAAAANASIVSVASLAAGTTLQFKAKFTNTGTSTLTTTATGTKSLVNLNGSNLAASTIQANAAVEVTWDGTKFLLSKRPFNDRVVVIDSN